MDQGQGCNLPRQVELFGGRFFLAHSPVALGRRRQGTPLFYDKDAEHGISPLMKNYIAGLLAHASEITYFLAPTSNSYKRFVAGTFAPTKIVWSKDNRTAGFRLCGRHQGHPH